MSRDTIPRSIMSIVKQPAQNCYRQDSTLLLLPPFCTLYCSILCTAGVVFGSGAPRSALILMEDPVHVLDGRYISSSSIIVHEHDGHILSYVGKDWNSLSVVLVLPGTKRLSCCRSNTTMRDERHSGVATRNLLFVFVIVFYGNSFLWLVLVSVASSRTTPPRAG